jgi:hypothetical protein
VPRSPRQSPHVREADPPERAWPERHASHTPPHSGTDGTTRREGHIDGQRGPTPPHHAGVAPLLPWGPLDPDVAGPGPLGAATGGTVGTGTPEASGNRRTTPGSAPPQWTRILRSPRTMRPAPLQASGRRLSERRRRENRTDGLRWRGLETWPWGMVHPPRHRTSGAGNPPPTAGAPVLDPTRRRPTALARPSLPLPAAPDARRWASFVSYGNPFE